ncbi:MAG TPA: hypothetical protein VFC29_00230 [Candidatus Limnocylindrales bacterium]|nr:hypothetical protein [Candidatus Limnocylindrales bacterium]
MTASDLVTVAATLLGTGLAYFVKGPKWGIGCLAAGFAMLLMLHFKKRNAATAETTSLPPINISPTFTQTFNAAPPTVSPVVTQEQSMPSARQTQPKLEVIGVPGIMPVGYDIFGVWRVGIGNAQGVIIGIRNAAASIGEKVGSADNLVASIEFKNSEKLVTGIVSRAHWLGEEGNEIRLKSGETASLLLAVIEDGRLLTYENPCDQPTVYIGRRRIPRSRPAYRGHVVSLDNDISIFVKIIDSEEGETMLEREVLITKEMGKLRFA